MAAWCVSALVAILDLPISVKPLPEAANSAGARAPCSVIEHVLGISKVSGSIPGISAKGFQVGSDTQCLHIRSAASQGGQD